MSSRKKTICSLLSAIALAPVLAVATPAYAQEAASGADAVDDGTIVVTARKRSEDVLKTPVSLSVLTSDAIAARGIVSVNDIANATPGINISNVSSGRSDRSFQQVSLRGFTPSTATSTLTATFIDGVPVASATALNTITDPERIEILKGPQSAYFGRNTFAGAINVVNKLPGNDLSGSVNGSWGTRDNLDFNASIEGAVIPDKLLARVSGRYFSKNGSYANKADPSQTLGDQRTYSGTTLIVAKPTERLTVKAFGLVAQNDDGPSAQGTVSAFEVRANNGAVNIPALSGSTAGTVIVAGQSNCTLTGFTTGLSTSEARVTRPFICGAAPGLSSLSPSQNTTTSSLLTAALANSSNRVVSGKNGVDGYGLKSLYYHLHLNVDYELGDTGITLSSLTGYNNEYYSELADLDNYDSRLLTNSGNPTGANPNLIRYYDFPYVIERRTRDFSQEVRASYDKGPLKAILGASYLRTESEADAVNISNLLLFGIAIPASARSAPQKSITKGIFGGVTYDLGGVTLSAEGRYQEDKIFAFSGGTATGLTIAQNNPYGLPAGTFGPLTAFFSRTFKNFLPRVIAQVDLNADVMAYASWSKGANVSLASFNTNFLNQSAQAIAAAQTIGLGVLVEPEKLSNYEVGVKGKFLNGKLRASIAGYYAIWSDQMNSRTATFVGATGSNGVVTGVANTGKSIVSGVEAEVQVFPVRGVSIDLAGAVNKSDIRTYDDPAVSRLTGVIGSGFRGNQLPGTSKYSANLGAQYGATLSGYDDLDVFARGDVSYKSKIFADAGNLTWIKSRTQVNLRVGVSQGPVSVEAFLINAFNNKRYVSIANNTLNTPGSALSGAYSYLSLGLPELRTFGMKVAYRF